MDYETDVRTPRLHFSWLGCLASLKIQETLLFRNGVPLSEVSKYIAYIGLWIVKKKKAAMKTKSS